MSIKLELDAASIKKAIMSHISNQGFDLAGKTVDVALVNGRGGNGNRATITISDDEPIKELKSMSDVEFPIKGITQELELGPDGQYDEIPEVTKIDPYVKTAIPQTVTEVEEVMPVVSQGEVEPGAVDPILAAAEDASDPFGEETTSGDSGLFPSVNPGDVETPKSLF